MNQPIGFVPLPPAPAGAQHAIVMQYENNRLATSCVCGGWTDFRQQGDADAVLKLYYGHLGSVSRDSC